MHTRLLKLALFGITLFTGYTLCDDAKNYTPTQNTLADQAVARKLINESLASKRSGHTLTQSEAQLLVPYVQSKLLETEWLALNEHFIKEAIEKEREYEDYCCFYTAIPASYILLQDVTRKLYKHTYGRSGGLNVGQKAFQFTRYTPKDLTYSTYPNVNAFLTSEFKKEGIVDDNLLRVGTVLVSTNLAFFGNIGLPGEFTHNYFNNPQSWAFPPKPFLENCLRSLGYSEQFVDELLEIATLVQSNKGMLFQYFIPSSIVNLVGYKSWRQGIPFDQDFIQKLFNRTSMTFGRSDLIFKAQINDAINSWKRRYRTKDAAVVAAVNDMLAKIQQGEFHLYPMLETYKQDPKSLIFANYFQGRLLVSNDYLLNPASGILVFRYLPPIDQEKYKQYKAKLKEIITRMVASKQQKTNKGLTGLQGL